MKPEPKTRKDSVETFAKAGIPAEWVPVFNKMGHTTVASLKSLKASKLFNDLCGYNKKNKLGLENPTMEEVSKWIEG
jgi:lysyl-tRNA synthetase, class II